MTKTEALYSFWNSFQITMYPTNAVPEKKAFPYGTYEVRIPSALGQSIGQCNLYFHTESEEVPNKKADDICRAITKNGKRIPYNKGLLIVRIDEQGWIASTTQDRSLKHRAINFSIENIEVE